MLLDIETGLLRDVPYIASPNCDDRNSGELLDLVVIHNISLPPGQFGGAGVEQLFTNRLDPNAHPYYREIHRLRVSAHLFIKRCGQIVQFVPLHKRAWHAGVSSYCGRSKCNDFSIGIELEGTDTLPFSKHQYQTLVSAVAVLLENYPGLDVERIVGHSDIAPGRKTDPGPHFNWAYFREQLNLCIT